MHNADDEREREARVTMYVLATMKIIIIINPTLGISWWRHYAPVLIIIINRRRYTQTSYERKKPFKRREGLQMKEKKKHFMHLSTVSRSTTTNDKSLGLPKLSAASFFFWRIPSKIEIWKAAFVAEARAEAKQLLGFGGTAASEVTASSEQNKSWF